MGKSKQRSKQRSKAPSYADELAAVIGTEEAAALLDVGAERVKQFCREGRLAAKRIGRDWVISRRAAEELATIDRPPIAKKFLTKSATKRR